MITTRHPADLSDTYLLDRIGPLRDLLFSNIETTGPSGDIFQLYLIGCIYHNGFGWKFIQWFVDSRESERELLTAFFTFMEHLKILVHFNGDGPDIPYLLKYCRRLDLLYNFDRIRSMDIYKKIKPYRKPLGLEDTKQKSIEQFLDLAREDKYNGGQPIGVYREYLMIHESFLYDPLILRSEDDLKDILFILPILSCVGIMEAPFLPESQRLFIYDDMTGNTCPSLSLTWKNRCAVLVSLAYDSTLVSLELNWDTPVYGIAFYRGKPKYFYSSYKDHYYPSLEDTAVHKSVDEYVDGDVRTEATVRTCHIKKQGPLPPQFGASWSPALMQEYKVSLICAKYEPETLASDSIADAYVR